MTLIKYNLLVSQFSLQLPLLSTTHPVNMCIRTMAMFGIYKLSFNCQLVHLCHNKAINMMNNLQ